MHHGLLAQARDEAEAHVRQRRHAVLTALLLHLGHDVLQHLHLVAVQLQLIQDRLVALDELRGGKAGGNPAATGMVVDQVHHRVDAAVHRAVVVARIVAEVHAPGPHVVARGVERVLDQFVDALILRGRDRHHRDAQGLLQRVYVDRAAVLAHLVHHVQRQHHGHVQLDQLACQVQVALDVRRVQDVDDAVGLAVQQEFPGHDLLAGVGRERVDARKVRDRGLGVAANRAVLAVHRHAREVAHVLVGAGELVEQRGLAAVLVARQCKADGFARRDDLAGLDVQLQVVLRHAGVRNLHARPLLVAEGVGLVHVLELDFRRICLA